ncbi:MAG: hypothetical protein EBS30_18885, partial [Planctomycetes bacterium]|nr:hypothetical protein [Planctomycetota bacterium]
MARWNGLMSLSAACLAGAVIQNSGSAQTPRASTAPAGAPAAHAVAIINGEVITSADLEQAQRWIGPSPVALPANRKRQQDLEALSLLIDDLLMQQFLRANGPQVSQTDLNQKLAELQAELKKQNKT